MQKTTILIFTAIKTENLMLIEDVWKQGAMENTWAFEEVSNRGLKKTA
jgi:hypothetical protein